VAVKTGYAPSGMDPDLQAAIQVASLAGNYQLAAELASREGFAGTCLRCAAAPGTVEIYTAPRYTARLVCADCFEAGDQVHLVYGKGDTWKDLARVLDAFNPNAAFQAKTVLLRKPLTVTPIQGVKEVLFHGVTFIDGVVSWTVS